MSSKTKTKAIKEEATPSLVLKLRFPEFRADGEWKIRLLGDLFSERQETGLTELPLLSLMDKEGIVPQEDTNRKNNSNNDKSKYLRVVPGDIAYNTMRMWEGRSAHVGLEGLVSPAYTVCVPGSDVHSLLFSYYFKTPSIIEQFRRYSQGLVKDTLNLKYAAFSQISVPTTSLVEQQKIASCLSSLDHLITAHTQKLNALKTYKKGLMQQLFPREGETVPRLRFPEFREDGEWEEAPLSQFILSLDAGISVNSGDRPASKTEFGVLKTSAVTNGVFEFEENKVVLAESEQSRLKEPVYSGTIIISRMNTPALVGANAFVEVSHENLFLPDRLWAAKPREGVSMRFLALILGSDKGRMALAKLAKGSSGSMKNITKPEVLAFPLMAPSHPEQLRIATCFTTLDDLITAQAQKLEALQTHKNGLMQGLFPSEKSNGLQSISH